MLIVETTSSAEITRIQVLRSNHQATHSDSASVTNRGSSKAPRDIHDQGVKYA